MIACTLLSYQYIKEYKVAGTGPEARSFCESRFCVDCRVSGGGGHRSQICPRSTINNFVNPAQICILLILQGASIMDLPQINNQQFCQSSPDLHSVDPRGGGGRQSTRIHPRSTSEATAEVTTHCHFRNNWQKLDLIPGTRGPKPDALPTELYRPV